MPSISNDMSRLRRSYLLHIQKQTLSITIGKAHLKWAALEEVLLYIEVNLNNKPLTYIEDDIAHQPLTLNSALLGGDVVLPTDQEATSEDEGRFLESGKNMC